MKPNHSKKLTRLAMFFDQMFFVTKSQQKKIEIVARPVVVEDGPVWDGPAEVRGVTHKEGQPRPHPPCP